MGKWEETQEAYHGESPAEEQVIPEKIRETNADMIRSMTDEELADFFVSREADACTHCEFYNSGVNRCYLDNPCVSELASVMLLGWLISEKGTCPGSSPGETVDVEN